MMMDDDAFFRPCATGPEILFKTTLFVNVCKVRDRSRDRSDGGRLVDSNATSSLCHSHSAPPSSMFSSCRTIGTSAARKSAQTASGTTNIFE